VRVEIDPPDGPGGSLRRSLPIDVVEVHAARNESLKKLYVGNLPFSATEEELREMFEQHGATVSVRIITDRETGRSRGFGFVEFEEDASAEKALQALDGRDMDGRALRVNEAQEREGRGGGGRR
jgi:RNA recognition motif-containing protein